MVWAVGAGMGATPTGGLNRGAFRHIVAAASAVAAVFGGLLPVAPTGAAAATPALSAAAADPRPNIVLVVMDDFSTDLLPTMRHAMEMRRTGAFYRHSYVVNSLCCPSRASLLTGQYPHQTRVLFNVNSSSPEEGPVGGYAAFEAHGNLGRSVNAQLRASGYSTGFIGKYLNGYGRADPAARVVVVALDHGRRLRRLGLPQHLRP